MNYSVMSYTFRRGRWKDAYSVEEICRWTARLGLDAVDWVTTYGMPAAEVRRIMDSCGLKTVCHTIYADLNPVDPADRAGMDSVRRGLDDAAVLGSPCVMLVVMGKKGRSRDESRRLIGERLPEAVSLAAAADIALTIEPFPGDDSPFVTSAEIRELLAAAPGLKVTFDGGNLLTGGENPVDGYLSLKDDVVFAHFKDWTLADPTTGRRMADGRWYRPALVGEGIVDYPRLVAAMRRAGYRGYANIEYEGDAYPPEEATRRALEYLRRIENEGGG